MPDKYKPDHEELLEALMRRAVSECIDIERLACLEQRLVESMIIENTDRDRFQQLVRDHIDRAWQELMFEFERIRGVECSSYVLEHKPLAVPYLGASS